MAKLFLHIGPHKTGSTYIQKCFFANRDYLLNLGVCYPNVDCGALYGQHGAVEKIKWLEQKELDKYWNQVLRTDINFVSSECFDGLNSPDIQKLSRALSKVDVRIIYYHRNYVDLLPSWWQKEVKHGSTLSLYEFILPHILRPFSSNIINPCGVLDLYANVFGQDNIIIIDYDRAVQNEGILHPILELLTIEMAAAKNEIVNASLKVEIVEIIRVLNAIAHFNNQWNGLKVRALFFRKTQSAEISGEVEKLAAMIRDDMRPLRLGSGFFEGSVNSAFRT